MPKLVTGVKSTSKGDFPELGRKIMVKSTGSGWFDYNYKIIDGWHEAEVVTKQSASHMNRVYLRFPGKYEDALFIDQNRWSIDWYYKDEDPPAVGTLWEDSKDVIPAIGRKIEVFFCGPGFTRNQGITTTGITESGIAHGSTRVRYRLPGSTTVRNQVINRDRWRVRWRYIDEKKGEPENQVDRDQAQEATNQTEGNAMFYPDTIRTMEGWVGCVKAMNPDNGRRPNTDTIVWESDEVFIFVPVDEQEDGYDYPDPQQVALRTAEKQIEKSLANIFAAKK
jgi:hypothetical protein